MDWFVCWNRAVALLFYCAMPSLSKSCLLNFAKWFHHIEGKCDCLSYFLLISSYLKSLRNKTLLFAFLLVEKNLDWYKKILLQALMSMPDMNINPKNCIGTVISINGFRKHFCVFHAKHPENRQHVSLYLFDNSMFQYFCFYRGKQNIWRMVNFLA